MNKWSERTELLLGEDTVADLANKRVLIVGLGGVGGYAAESLCRAGVGYLTIVDGDVIDPSNINRQLLALHNTVGKSKSELLLERLQSINPNAEITALNEFISGDRIDELINHNVDGKYDYVVDAIDTLLHKVTLIATCVESGTKIVSAMGAGGKVDPSQIKIGDISESYNCKLAKMVRKRLHKRDIFEGFQVVFSPEDRKGNIIKISEEERNESDSEVKTASSVGTISYMPAIFGLQCASVVLRDFIPTSGFILQTD